jgi:hypothetical protein
VSYWLVQRIRGRGVAELRRLSLETNKRLFEATPTEIVLLKRALQVANLRVAKMFCGSAFQYAINPCRRCKRYRVCRRWLGGGSVKARGRRRRKRDGSALNKVHVLGVHQRNSLFLRVFFRFFAATLRAFDSFFSQPRTCSIQAVFRLS